MEILHNKLVFGCQMGKWYLVGSEAINYEISLTPDYERKEKVNVLASLARDIIIVDKNIKKRAGNLINIGFKRL